MALEHAYEPSADDGSPESRVGPIVIVDDEPAILELIGDILQDEGFTVLKASSGTAALQIVRKWPVALVLTDLMMPNLTGLELARRLRSDPATAAIPLILMSAAMPPGRDDMFAATVHKPFPLEVVVRAVRGCLSL